MIHRRMTRPPAFSLVEMLVVVGIISLILGILLLVGRSGLNTAKVSDTRTMLNQLHTALLKFENTNPYRANRVVQRRYGSYPPDELMAYDGCSGSEATESLNLMPGGFGGFAKVGSAPITDDYQDNNFVEHGAVKALVWALRSREETRVIFESIPSRFRVTVPYGTAPGNEFFDLDDGCYPNCGSFNAGCFDQLVDQEVQYLVDGWGNPLEYFATREEDDDPTPHAEIARRVIQVNRNVPVIMSYGLDGELQISAGKTLERLYTEGTPGDAVFADTLNEDNLYVDDQLGERMREIIKE